MPYALAPQDLSFLERAQYRLDYTRVVSSTPETVFAVLADKDTWPKWFVDFKRAELTSPQREGLGMTRKVWVGPMVLEERFVAWIPGRRYSFTMLSTNLPILSAMLEDWRLTPDGGKTRLDYTVVYDLPWWMRPFGKLLLWRFGPMFDKALPNLGAFVEKSRP